MNKEFINNKLVELSEERGVEIIYACESGSRAWGFSSSDSDYDIRFIYAHNPRWYLALNSAVAKDTIHYDEADLDITGWDLKKALYLFYKSNPGFMEWLNSPIVYTDTYALTGQLRAWMTEHGYWNRKSAQYHYFHMAKNNWKNYLQNGHKVLVKKYLYVVRPMLAVLWIQEHGTPVPVRFETLLKAMVEPNTPLYTEIENLLIDKRAGKELSYGDHRPAIDNFVENLISWYDTEGFDGKRQRRSLDLLNVLFIETLEEVWA